MKKFYVLIMLTVAVTLSVYSSGSEEVKGVDKSEYVTANKADAVSGVIDASSPEFDRRWTNAYDANCSLSTFSAGTRYYQVYPFYSVSDEPLDISSTTTGGSGDMHFTVYCDPFDANNSDLNITAINDDSGPGSMPAFDPANSYNVSANTQYYLVVSTWGAGATGTYDISLGGDFVFGTLAPPPAVPLSNWAFALIGLFALTLVFIKFRK